MVERCLSIQHIGSPEDQASSARSLVVQVAPGRSVAYSLDYFCRIVVVGAGKAAVSMAAGVETVLLEHAPDALKGGVVVTKYGHVAGGPPLRRIRALEAAHPVPDEASVNATNEVVRLLDAVSDDSRTLVVVLISGGGSSLWSAPEPGLGLADLQATNQALLGSGMPIAGMNLIRKHVDQLKGGGLLRRAGQAQVLSLVLSDVIGDDLSTIASGPTVPFERDFVQTLAELDKFNLRPSRAQREQERRVAPRDGDAGAFPLRVYEHLLQGAMKQRSTDQPAVPSADAKGVPLLDRDSRIPSLSLDAASSGPALSNVTNVLVGSNLHSLRAAARRATELGYDAQVLTDRLDGEAATAGQWLARAAIPALGAANVAAPAASSARAWIAGGETTVTFHTSQQQQQPSGLGGRTQELALAGALALAQHESPASPRGCRTVLLAGGSDGTDGPTDATGAVVDAMTVSRAARSGLDAADFLRRHDSYTFFDRLDQAAAAASSSSTSSAPKAPLPPAHLKPGPTGTNVGDVMLVLQK
jgi:hydroxypyruvate reductase